MTVAAALPLLVGGRGDVSAMARGTAAGAAVPCLSVSIPPAGVVVAGPSSCMGGVAWQHTEGGVFVLCSRDGVAGGATARRRGRRQQQRRGRRWRLWLLPHCGGNGGCVGGGSGSSRHGGARVVVVAPPRTAIAAAVQSTASATRVPRAPRRPSAFRRRPWVAMGDRPPPRSQRRPRRHGRLQNLPSVGSRRQHHYLRLVVLCYQPGRVAHGAAHRRQGP